MKKAFGKHFALTILFGSLVSGSLAQAPNRPDPLLGQIKDLLRQKKPLQAIELLNKALKDRPNEAQLWLALGYAHESAKKIDDSLAAFRKAQKLNPKFPGIDKRIKSLESQLKAPSENAGSSKAAPQTKGDEARTPEEQKAAELMRNALREKSYGRFDEAFQFFIQAADLDSSYLSGNDEGIIRTALNYYQEKMEVGDQNAELYYSIFRDFQGDSDIAERGLLAFLGKNPPQEKADLARKHLEMIQARSKKLDAMEQASKSAPPQPPLVSSAGSASQPAQVITVPKPVPSKTFSDDAHPSSKGGLASKDYVGSIVDPTPAAPSKHPLTDSLLLQAKSDDPEESAHAIWKLGDLKIATPESLSLIAEQLRAEDRVKMIIAMEAAERMGKEAGPLVPHLLEIVRGDDQYRKFNALVALQRIRLQPEVVIPTIMGDLVNSNTAIANSAMAAIVAYGHDALPLLAEAAKDPSSPYQKQAIAIIAQLGSNTQR